MPQGNRGHIGIKKETTWGERAGGDNDIFFPFISETLTADIEDVVSAIQRGERDEPRSYQGQKDFAGDIVVEVHPKSIGHILRSAINIPDPTGEFASSKITVIADCETVWEHSDTGIITSLDPGEKRKGLNSCKIQVSAGVGAVPTVLASRVFADDLQTTSHYKFWIRCSIALVEDEVKFRVSDAEFGAEGTAEDTVTIPDMAVPYKWYEFTIAIGNVGDLGTAISCALVQLVDKGEMTLWIDDVRIVETGAPAATEAREHVFTPIKTHAQEFNDDCPLRPYTLEVFKDDGAGVTAFEFMGAVVSKLSLAFSSTDKIVKATLGIIAKDLDKIAHTVLGLETTNPFMWNDAKIFIANKDAAVDITADTDRCNDLESFNVDFDNNCIAKFALNNTTIARKFIFNGYVSIPVNFVVDFVSQTEFDYFLAGTERQFIIVLDSDIIKAAEPTFKYRLRIDMPLVRYTAYPINTGGPGRMSCAVVGKAKYSGEADWKYAIRFTIWNKQTNTEYA